MADFIFRPITNSDDAAWNELVCASPIGNAFLQSATLVALAANEVPRAQVWRVGAFAADSGRLEAGWAVLKRRRLGIRYCSSFPLFYAGPVLHAEWLVPERVTARMDLLYGLTCELQKELDVIDTEAAPELPDVRGLLYAGCHVEQIYCHVWPACAPEEVSRLAKRTKRQEAASARKRHQFGWRNADPKTLAAFECLHKITLRKFKWVAPETWHIALRNNMVALETLGICRIYAAAPRQTPDDPCALVSVLFSPAQQRAWLWRVAYQTDDSGLVPALYLHAAEAIKAEFGSAWTINFGGSPNRSLARFKDYLGATSVGHWRIRWQRNVLKMACWNVLVITKEIARRQLTLWQWIRPR